MRYQFSNLSEHIRVEISLKSSSARVYFVILNQTCCKSSQYSLLDMIFHAITFPSQGRVNFKYSLLWLTRHIRSTISISHLSILGIVVYYRCCISHCFYVFLCLQRSIKDIFLHFYLNKFLLFLS